MRERLLAAFAGLTLLTVLLYGVPRAVVRADIVSDEARTDLRRSAQVLGEVLSLRREAGREIASAGAPYVGPQDQVRYDRGGVVEVLRGSAAPREDDLVAVAPVAGGGSVEVRRPRSALRRDVVQALTPIVLTGVVALGIAVLAAVLLAARLARPFRQLADAAEVLGSGGFDVDLPPQRVREAEAIAAALRTSGERLASMLAREREFARNASHQLRTPLTGMRLRVEDLALWPETAPEVREELGHVLAEVDRLGDTVTALLSFARQEHLTAWQETALDEVARAAAGRWQVLAKERGRRIEVTGETADRLALPRNTVDQVLDVLIDNAIKHGSGTITVDARAREGAACLRVLDEGEATAPDAELFRRRRSPSGSGGEGIGLALCAELATAAGGRLQLASRRPTTFELRVPVRR